MLRHNLGLKLFSLLLAIAVWFFVIAQNPRRSPIRELRTSVPLKVVGLARGLTASEVSSEVQITIRGLRRDLEEQSEEVQAEVNLAGRSAGIHRVEVTAKAAAGISVASIQPSHVRVVLERVARRARRVSVLLLAAPPAGYPLQTPEVVPALVEVSGATSVVDRVAEVVATVATQERDLGRPQTVAVRAVDAAGQEVPRAQINPSRVRITLPPEPGATARLLPVEPRLKGVPAPGYRITRATVTPAEVLVKGRPGSLARLNWLETSDVSVEDATADVAAEAMLPMPIGVTAGSVRTVRVQVTIVKSFP